MSTKNRGFEALESAYKDIQKLDDNDRLAIEAYIKAKAEVSASKPRKKSFPAGGSTSVIGKEKKIPDDIGSQYSELSKKIDFGERFIVDEYIRAKVKMLTGRIY